MNTIRMSFLLCVYKVSFLKTLFVLCRTLCQEGFKLSDRVFISLCLQGFILKTLFVLCHTLCQEGSKLSDRVFISLCLQGFIFKNVICTVSYIVSRRF